MYNQTQCTYMFWIEDSDAPPMLRKAGLSLLAVRPRKKIQIASASIAMNAKCFKSCNIGRGCMVLGRVSGIVETVVCLVLDSGGDCWLSPLEYRLGGMEAQSGRSRIAPECAEACRRRSDSG